jgi:hypothetical protein
MPGLTECSSEGLGTYDVCSFGPDKKTDGSAYAITGKARAKETRDACDQGGILVLKVPVIWAGKSSGIYPVHGRW